MAKIKKGKTLTFTTREECFDLMVATQTNVYTPRPQEIWKSVKTYQYCCVIEKKKCVQAYIKATNQYDKPLEPYIFWDKDQQLRYHQRYRQDRFLTQADGEAMYRLSKKMKRYYKILKIKGRI